MTNLRIDAETRFYGLVLGSWWLAVSVLSVLRLAHGDRFEGVLLILSASLTALLGVALWIDRARDVSAGAAKTEVVRLQSATALFSVIAISTVIGCAVIKGALWWAAVECAALVWIVPAVIFPLAQAYMAKRALAHTA
jgi:hypothetical protein